MSRYHKQPTEWKNHQIEAQFHRYQASFRWSRCDRCGDRLRENELFDKENRITGETDFLCHECLMEVEDEAPGMTQLYRTLDEKQGGDWDELIGRLHRMGQQIDDLKNTEWYRRKTV